MSTPPHDDDPWQLRPAESVKQQPGQPSLRVETIGDITPLDTQLGVSPKKTVPDALHDAMFGQPDPSPAEIEAAGGDPAGVPPMRTYAILDAAKVPGLPAMLEGSGLPHCCLFRGAAYKELKDVAPWIVQLNENSDFCRQLFTSGKAHWQLWNKAPGIYLRSRASLEALWGHFRKFTRIQDESGKWFYFRFYDPACVAVTQSLLLAVDSSIRQPLPYPAQLIVTGPDVKRARWVS